MYPSKTTARLHLLFLALPLRGSRPSGAVVKKHVIERMGLPVAERDMLCLSTRVVLPEWVMTYSVPDFFA